MDRFTEKPCTELSDMHKCDKYLHFGSFACNECDKKTEVYKRLAAYEDTELSPEQISLLEYTLLGVMHSVDKWLDGKDLKLDEVNRAAKMREITLDITEKQESEIAALKAENERLRAERDTKRGKWFFVEYEYFTCSVCGESYYNGSESTAEAEHNLAHGYTYKFCPHCGADMRTEASQ